MISVGSLTGCPRRTAQQSGFSLLEVVFSTLIVGVLIVAALRSVGTATSGQLALAQQSQSSLLAQALLAEITNLPYEDPNEPPRTGPEGSEGVGSTRAAFDDVDDYHEWSSKPPQEKDGSVISHLSAWRRVVAVYTVDPNDHLQQSTDDLGAKLVKVTVKHGQHSTVMWTVVTNSE